MGSSVEGVEIRGVVGFELGQTVLYDLPAIGDVGVVEMISGIVRRCAAVDVVDPADKRNCGEP